MRTRLGFLLLLAVAECLDMSLKAGVARGPGDRATCGLVTCVEDRSSAPSGPTGAWPQMSSLTVLKRTGAAGRTRTLATLTALAPTVSRTSDGVKIDGSWTAQRAEVTLDLVKQADCSSSQFSCQLVLLDQMGGELVSSTTLDTSLSRPGTPRDQALDQSLTLQISDLVQQLVGDNKKDTLLKNVASSVDSLKTYIEDRFSNIESKLDTLVTSREANQLVEKVNSTLGLLESHITATVGAVSAGLDHLNEAMNDTKGEILLEITTARNNTDHTICDADLQPDTSTTLSIKHTRENSSGTDERFRNSSLTKDAHGNSSCPCDAYGAVSVEEKKEGTMQNETTGSYPTATPPVTVRPTVCEKGMELQNTSAADSPGYVVVQAPNPLGIPHLCDAHTDGGGWVLVQRRTSGDVDFDQDFSDYKHGFGALDTDFWLGNENIRAITSGGKYELRIEADYGWGRYVSVYDRFGLEDEAHDYRLILGSERIISGSGFNLRPGFGFLTSRNSRNSLFYSLHKPYLSGGWWSDTSKIFLTFFRKLKNHPNMDWRKLIFSEMKIRRL